MTKIKVGINGMGRIGRTVLREFFNRNESEFEIVAVNNPGKAEQYVHLLKYDSVHGPFQGDVHLEGDSLSVNGKLLKFYSQKDPSEIPWGDLGVQVVIDSTGVFKDKEGLSKHMHGTVKKVIMCAPGKGLDATFVMGVNHNIYDAGKHHVISNASCTTNCLAPIVKVLNEKFGIETGFMTTVHSYTSDQMLLDGSHSDPRRARAAAMSIIPTTTGAAKTVGEIIPELKGKLDGYSFRVPTPNVSLTDFVATLKKPASAAEINAALKEASETSLKGILRYETEELVSVDFMGMRHSSCLDASLTNVIGNTVKVVSWYDNEAGFSNRVLDLVKFIGSKGL
ncbi:type I glyceraldehyde-3-phosphate dehydrogenase [Bacteriovorax stolpii]|uniref:Glyceraldehyde-3-phosphate dehydrogenase n=1 Tax=Bacteriovorax stolpii TaxID=960 RepID=A0A2K9NNB3_BACTC|nr:type I glyceraldehyde-3-phosphate dehydrogenase [Bacteriovorax stolpii]AUN97016.1 type I glyceraldehyde-3-phosphate dehydrogenase [Bacteriovorax stolpii]QDK43054.1 type I glyceraldehyde-3-phosphate dehydrogenase [Bacteriovorax stolpii]TDP53302.1 glyceraldehyde-3-phosphate dehydrogenase (NAD+) [Bacteriovorax stolpii]